MAKQHAKQCKNCETAMDQDSDGAWTHRWTGLNQCKSVATRRMMSSYATPRADK